MFSAFILISCSSDKDLDSDPELEANTGLSDDFNTDGPLVGYTTNNETALPDIRQDSGRYLAVLTDNDNDKTLHYNQSQGRLDAKKVLFPFQFIARNIGIGTIQDSQTALPHSSNGQYTFCGVQVHVTDLENRNSSHIVIGHRGGTGFTIEGKNTVNGTSSVDDIGPDQVPTAKADLRIVGNEDRTLTIYWQVPNLSLDAINDNWKLYKDTGKLPNQAPAYGKEVYIGLITYALGNTGVPFVGTCDGIEISQNQ